MFLTEQQSEPEHEKFGLVPTLCLGRRLKCVNTVLLSPLHSEDPGQFGFSKLETLYL